VSARTLTEKLLSGVLDSPNKRWHGTAFVPYILVPLIMIGAGAAIALQPVAILIAISLIVVVALLNSPRVRAIFVVLGGIIILQSSQNLSAQKAAYLGGVVLCFVVAILDMEIERDQRIILRSSALVAFAIVISFVSATTHGTSVSNYLRDASGYALFAASPILAFDFAKSGYRFILGLFLTAGLVATISFTAEWISNHGLGYLPINKFALSSFMLVAATFAYACASLVLRERPRIVWVAVAVLTAGALVLTGTRSSLALLAAPFTMLLAPSVRSATRAVKVAVSTGLLVLLVVGTVAFAGSVIGSNATGALARVVTVVSLTGTRLTDSSDEARIAVTTLAWKTFKSAPLFGVGAGYTWEYVLPYQTATGTAYRSSLTIDTTVAVIAEFGVFGFIILLYYLWTLGRYVWRREPSPSALCLLGVVGVFAAYSLTTNAFEDKGLGLVSALLIALVVAKQQQAERRALTPNASD
jgi:O-antigen ligase